MININMKDTSVNDCFKEALKAELRDSDFQTKSVMSMMIPAGILVTATFFVTNDSFKL